MNNNQLNTPKEKFIDELVKSFEKLHHIKEGENVLFPIDESLVCEVAYTEYDLILSEGEINSIFDAYLESAEVMITLRESIKMAIQHVYNVGIDECIDNETYEF